MILNLKGLIAPMNNMKNFVRRISEFLGVCFFVFLVIGILLILFENLGLSNYYPDTFFKLSEKIISLTRYIIIVPLAFIKYIWTFF